MSKKAITSTRKGKNTIIVNFKYKKIKNHFFFNS